MRDMPTFLASFARCENFSFIKINHGFWEGIADAYAAYGEPIAAKHHVAADRVARRPFFFEGGFVDELLQLLRKAVRSPDRALFIGLELSAWPGDEALVGTPVRPERSNPVVKEFRTANTADVDGLLLKRAVMDGEILKLFDTLRSMRVILVGPQYIEPLGQAAGWEHFEFLPIHPKNARKTRLHTETQLRSLLDQPCERATCVLLQAGTLAPYWILRLRDLYPRTRWIDGGLAFSIASPEDLLERHWGQVYRKEILSTYRQLQGSRSLPVRNLIGEIGEGVQRALQETQNARKVAFVERKSIDTARLEAFLRPAELQNRWANRGPLWHILGDAYHRHLRVPKEFRIVPCANGGLALMALAALHASKAQRRLRWVVSAFGFYNTTRGPFFDAQIVDCDDEGLLRIQALQDLDPNSYDGIIVTNVFGLARDFTQYAEHARRHRKILMLDNAAGIGPFLPAIPYQALSLHHTKPYGFGEGGLAVVPAEEADKLLALMEYSPVEAEDLPYWVGNGKLSELSCAVLLQRLESSPEWAPFYFMQSRRIQAIAHRAGLKPLMPIPGQTAATSLPFLLPRPVPTTALENDFFTIGKYYKPLAPLPTATDVYQRIVNIPSHPDMKCVETNVLLTTLGALVAS